MKSPLFSENSPNHSTGLPCVENPTSHPFSEINDGSDDLSAGSDVSYFPILAEGVPTAPLVDALVLSTYLTLEEESLPLDDPSFQSAIAEPSIHTHPDVIAKYVDQVTGLVDWQGFAREKQDLYNL